MNYPAVLRCCPRVAVALAEAQALAQATSSGEYNPMRSRIRLRLFGINYYSLRS